MGSRDEGSAVRDGGVPGADAGTKPGTDAGAQPPGPGDGGAGETDGGEAGPDGGSLESDGGTVLFDGGTGGVDGGTPGQDGGTLVQDAGTVAPDGGTVPPDGGTPPLDGGTQPADAGCAPGTMGCGLSPKGTPCGSPSECQNGFCVDGVCCDSACNGHCMTCIAVGKIGKCTDAPSGTDPESECGAGLCGSGACVLTCTTNAQCKTGATCKQGTCAFTGTTKANGESCAAGTDCATGFCVDGVCCASACNGPCQACSTAAGASVNGSCGSRPNTTVCRPAAGPCDVAETCSSGQCPADGFKSPGTTCGTPSVVMGTCGFDSFCAEIALQATTTTPYACNATGGCVAQPSTPGLQSCGSRSTAGATCLPTGTFDESCVPDSECATTGTYRHSETTWTCSSGNCSGNVTAVSLPCDVTPPATCNTGG